MIPSSDQFFKAMQLPIKMVYIKLEMYDSNWNYLREITQSVNKDSIGSISVDSERDIRRSFSFSLINKDNEFTFGADKLVWLDKRVKLYIGLKLPNGTIEYIPQGVFILTSPSSENGFSGSYTELTGQDKAYLFTGNLGKFINTTTIKVDTKVTDALRIIAQGETLFNFDNVTTTVPYELTYEPNTNRWEAIKELARLAKCEIYYDIYGYLRLKQIDLDNIQNYSPVWNFNNGDKFYAGNVRSLQDERLFNHIVVLGGSGQTATVSKELKVTETDNKWLNNPYSIEKIGHRVYLHNGGSPDGLITTEEEAFWRCKYELMKSLGYIEGVSMQTSPFYSLESDDVISITDEVNDVSGRYLIKRLTVPLNPALMQVECMKEHKFIDDWNFI